MTAPVIIIENQNNVGVLIETVRVISTSDQGPPGPPGAGAELQGSFFLLTGKDIIIPLVSSSRFAFSIDRLYNLVVESGQITATLRINGVNITGLTGIVVTSTPQSPIATALNEVDIGDRVELVLSANAAAVRLEFTLSGSIEEE